MLMHYFVFFIMFFSGAMSFSFKRKHLLLVLLSLEFIVLSLFFYLYVYLSLYTFEMYLSLVFISFSVCEGALGLSLLVSIIRVYGNDCYFVFNVLW